MTTLGYVVTEMKHIITCANRFHTLNVTIMNRVTFLFAATISNYSSIRVYLNKLIYKSHFESRANPRYKSYKWLFRTFSASFVCDCCSASIYKILI